jgi:D-glycero-alpha-D-manno-heptose 1-phosphate guanylyltransferase
LSTIKECIILAGGLGTRLRDTVPGLPKCMAPIAGKPFLHYLLKYLEKQGITRFILSLGYKHEIIEEFISVQFSHFHAQLSIEKEPLGTGGAIRLACSKCETENAWIVNGDTFFKIDLEEMMNLHTRVNAHCTLALKPMQQFTRYGSVELDKSGRITNFREKQFIEQGLINGGIYTLNIFNFLKEDFPEKFSFEKDFLEKSYETRNIFGSVEDAYFIDIGIPEDYERAQREVDWLIC